VKLLNQTPNSRGTFTNVPTTIVPYINTSTGPKNVAQVGGVSVPTGQPTLKGVQVFNEPVYALPGGALSLWYDGYQWVISAPALVGLSDNAIYYGLDTNGNPYNALFNGVIVNGFDTGNPSYTGSYIINVNGFFDSLTTTGMATATGLVVSQGIDLYDSGPRVAMDPSTIGSSPAGFVVTWANFTSTANGYDVLAQQFAAGGTPTASGALNTSATVTVNQTLANWQLMPAVGVDSSGDITVAWTTYGQDNAANGQPGILDYGIYARVYYSGLSGKGLAGTNTGEFRVNATTKLDQVAPALASSNFENDSLITWVGPDTKNGGTAIYSRDVDPPPPVSANTEAPVQENPAAIVIAEPKSDTVIAGKLASFAVAAIGTPAPTVQWQMSSNGGATYVAIPGATATTYSFTTTAAQSGNLYRAVFTNSVSTATTTAAALTVDTPPVVTTDLSSNKQTVGAGVLVSFTAAASGTPTPSVQWQVSTNGGGTFVAIPGATSSTYGFTATVAQSGNLYRAVFTNSLGTATTAAAALAVTPAPVVTANPANQTAIAGKAATFTAAGTGTPMPSVQWQVSSNGGATYVNLLGATSTTYVFTTAIGQSGSLYRAVFTNSYGSTATTTAATLTVNAAPAVTTSPSSLTVGTGLLASFTAAATGAPAPTVQWQISKSGVWTNITGATSTTYAFTAAAAQSGSQYRAVFTNSLGAATTAAATLTVNSAPIVVTNPSSQTVNAGQSVSFTAAAKGTPTPTVQWQVSANGSTWTSISGATSSIYTFTTSTLLPGNQYRALFVNSAGAATTTAATLTVNSAPVVKTNPGSQSIVTGQTASFIAAATGTPTPTVQWQVSTNKGVTYTNVLGANSTTYTFTTATAQSGYLYRAVFTNSLGTATTTAATLTVVNAAPVVTTSPSSQSIVAGQTASFTAAATGAPTPTVQWQVSTNKGTAYSNILGATSTTYTFTTAAAQSGYLYRAVFTNSAGAATTVAATLTVVNPAPVVTTSPSSQSIVAGKAVSFTAAASGTSTVQWQVSTNKGAAYANILGATSTTYTFTTAAAQSGYMYRAVFTNSTGTATTVAATLTVSAATSTASSASPVQASTLSGSSATNLNNSTSTPSSSTLTSLNPTAVGLVLATRL
jgi:hypothetical protein